MKRQTDITITGSEGLIGSALCKYFKKKGRSVKKLDIKLGHDLTNERFVKKWFKENPTQNLINCFAIDDKIDSTVKKSDLFNFPLEKFSNYFNKEAPIYIKTPDPVIDWIRMVCVNRLTGHSSGFFSGRTMPPNQAISSKAQVKINKKLNILQPERDIKKIILRISKMLLRDAVIKKVNNNLNRN